MTVREIILTHLRKVGADGLCGDACSCPLDDLMADCGMGGPCNGSNCVPAKADYDGHGDEIFVPMEKED